MDFQLADAFLRKLTGCVKMKLSDAQLALELNTKRENLIGRAERILSHKTVKVSVGHHKTEEMSISASMVNDIIIRVTLEEIAGIDKEIVEMGFERPEPPFFDSDLKDDARRVAQAMQSAQGS